jgi:ZIP family zinc transporter
MTMKAGQYVAVMMMIVEMVGAFCYLKTKDSGKRMVLSCLALGFAYAIIIADILPDATENFQWGYLICIGAIGFMFLLEMAFNHISSYTAVGGMAFHNFFEGIVVMSRPSIYPLLVAGIVLHKLPEGMVTFSLLDHVKKDKVKFIVAACIGLLIPIGTIVPIPEAIVKPITGFAAGVMLYAISKTMKRSVLSFFDAESTNKVGIITAAMVGAIIGGISCMLI